MLLAAFRRARQTVIRLPPTERGLGEVDASRLCAEQPGAGGGDRCIKECSFQMLRMSSEDETHQDGSRPSKYNHQVSCGSGSHAMEVEWAEAVHQRARQCQLIGRRS